MSLCNHDDIEIYKAVDVFRKKHQILTIFIWKTTNDITVNLSGFIAS